MSSGEPGWAPEPGGPLAGLRVATCGPGAAVWHAGRLLASLGATVWSGFWPEADGVIDAVGAVAPTWSGPAVRTVDTTAVEDWASCGAMALTGRDNGPALRTPGQPASAAWGALLATELLGRIGGRAVVLPGPRVLAERAAIAGRGRSAPSSVSGAFRMLRAADGWVGLNLARSAELLPLWLGETVPLDDPWPTVTAAVARRDAAKLVVAARRIGLPAVMSTKDDEQLVARDQAGETWPFVLNGAVRRARPGGGPVRVEPRRWRLPSTLVVDLSSLWAGPLCANLLGTLGARVVKVEDSRVPDPARFGPPGFFDLLHGGHESVALDFGTPQGRAALDRLVDAADVVLANYAPVPAERVLARSPGKCWVSITAYGRTGPWARVPGFGDDSAVAGGLLAFDTETWTAAPCGDAIAAPLAGVNAALAALACRLAGGTWLVDLALREQAAATLVRALEPGPTPAVASPVSRRPSQPAATLGAHTEAVLAEFR
ncbi:CoA transferase [Amycolatopsis acidicola]|uniref:CoA transferase n=1 Tax=Amycolatopsis acidicola TaxID=2596893 RepID=UPI001FB78C4F|nr:CoA transferase [Amycolatopsis acidicola]